MALVSKPTTGHPIGHGAARSITIVGLALQFLAMIALTLGPWADEPDELAGWDVERFQAIADAGGRAWTDHPVEYPPGSVVLIETLAGDGVVTTHRLLAVASFAVLLAITIALDRRVGTVGAAAFVMLGLPLVPGGLVRFDLWAAGLGLAALFALWADDRAASEGRARSTATVFAAVSIVFGAAVKVMPVVLIPLAIAKKRWGAVIAACFAGVLAGVAWLAFAGGIEEGIEAIRQVVSLRGTTGWHVESVPGALIALFSSDEARLEQNAYRIGTISSTITTLGRASFALIAVGLIALRRHATDLDSRSTRSRDAAMIVSLIAALLVTAPLLSPQFLLWITPFAAVVAAETSWRHPLVIATGVATTITGATLAIFGPPGVDAPLAAGLLTARNALLIALIALGARHLIPDRSDQELVAHHQEIPER